MVQVKICALVKVTHVATHAETRAVAPSVSYWPRQVFIGVNWKPCAAHLDTKGCLENTGCEQIHPPLFPMSRYFSMGQRGGLTDSHPQSWDTDIALMLNSNSVEIAIKSGIVELISICVLLRPRLSNPSCASSSRSFLRGFSVLLFHTKISPS